MCLFHQIVFTVIYDTRKLQVIKIISPTNLLVLTVDMHENIQRYVRLMSVLSVLTVSAVRQSVLTDGTVSAVSQPVSAVSTVSQCRQPVLSVQTVSAVSQSVLSASAVGQRCQSVL